MSDSGEIPAQNSPDWLPAGWIAEVKSRNGRNIKSYLNTLTGQRFYSKPKVLESLGTMKTSGCTSQKEITANYSDYSVPQMIKESPILLPHGLIPERKPQENDSHSENIYQAVAAEVSESGKIYVESSPDWLPAGWTVEVKANGRKTYIDQLTGHRFYSRPQVLEYLGTARNDSYTSPQKTMDDNSNGNLLDKIGQTPESLPHGLVPMITTQENASQRAENYKLGASELSPSGQVEKSPEWLPASWTVEVHVRNDRKIKCYVDSRTGRKFYSKPKVLEYLGTAKVHSGTSEKKKMGNDFDINLPVKINDPPESVPRGEIRESESRENGFQAAKNHLSPVKTIDTTSSLPDGWITEMVPRGSGARGGKYYKRYTDPVTGRKFFSKQKVLEYLGSAKLNSGASQQQKVLNSVSNLNMDKNGGTPTPHVTRSQDVSAFDQSGFTSTSKETSSNKQPGRTIGIEQLSSEGLPPGWIKEVKIQKNANGTRKIAYYIDPASGYVFSSQKDVFRYLEAGDISKCVTKPKKREEMGFGTPPSKGKVESKTPPQLLEGSKSVNTRQRAGLSSEVGGMSSSKINVSTRKRTRLASDSENLSLSKEPDSEVVIERVIAEGLPSGWIKEVKTEKYYTDPRSGYVFMSQKDALSYLETGDVSKCAIKPRSRDELGLSESSALKVDETGRQPPSQKLERSHTGKTPKNASFSSPQKEMSSSKLSGREIVIERVTPEGLPLGWIKEIRIQKKAQGTRKDPYYTDPVNGYVFSSHKDVLRYIETGDASTCAIRPKTRDELGLNQGRSVVSPPVMKKSGRGSATKQLSTGNKISPKRSFQTMDTDVSQKRQTRSSASAIIYDTVTVEIPKEMPSLNDVIEKRQKTKTANGSSRLPLPKTIGSKRKRGSISSPPLTDNNPQEKNVKKTAIKKNSNRKEIRATKKKVKKTQSPSSTPKKKGNLKPPSRSSERISVLKTEAKLNSGTTTRPSRSSKRMSGLKTEMTPNSGVVEQVITAVAEKSGNSDDISFPNAPHDLAHNTTQQYQTPAETSQTHIAEAEKSLKNEDNFSPNTPNDEFHDAPQQLEAVIEMVETNHALAGTETPSNAEVSNKSKDLMKNQGEDQNITQEQPLYQFSEEAWADPCLDFAFKTLTGSIPFEDNVPPNIFQPQTVSTPIHNADNCLTLLDFGPPGFSQVDKSRAHNGPPGFSQVNKSLAHNHFGAPNKPETQLPTRPILLPDINSSLTSSSENAYQQNDYERDHSNF